MVDALASTPVVPALLRLTGMSALAGDALSSLVNLSEHVALNREMIAKGTVERCVEAMADSETPNHVVELYGMLLSNLTRSEDGVESLCQTGTKLSGLCVFKLLNCLRKNRTDTKRLQEGLAWAALVLMNCTGHQSGRDCMLNESRAFLKMIVPLLRTDSVLLRRGIAGTLKNCCFDHDRHMYLLKEEFQLVVGMLHPLVPPVVFDAEDSAGMDPLLSTFDSKKKVEPDKDTRLYLLEALAQLTASEEGRNILRKKKVYPIIREMDKIEHDDEIHDAAFQIVDHLMSDEGGDSPSDEHKASGLKHLLQGVAKESKEVVDAKKEADVSRDAAKALDDVEEEEESSEETDEEALEDLLELD